MAWVARPPPVPYNRSSAVTAQTELERARGRLGDGERLDELMSATHLGSCEESPKGKEAPRRR